jgi:hypothetical protein
MGSITIHDLDDELGRRLTAEAQRQRTSKNSLIKRILAREMGLPAGESYADDYREFVGVWRDSDLREFQSSQNGSSSVDPGDWR